MGQDKEEKAESNYSYYLTQFPLIPITDSCRCPIGIKGVILVYTNHLESILKIGIDVSGH